MKVLKIFGIVAGIHAIALLLIFANPGCTSAGRTAASAPPAASVSPAAVPAPDNSGGTAPLPAPIVEAPGASAPAPVAEAPSESPAIVPASEPSVFYSPIRPGTPAAAAVEAQPVGGITPAKTYTVVRGDSLWMIAKRNHVKLSELEAANNLKPGARLQLGQKLIIPAGAAPAAASAPAAEASAGSKPEASDLTYTVRSGDTLGGIAHRCGVKLGDLAALNNIADPKKIHPGQVLSIPQGGHVPRASRAAAQPAASEAASAPPPAEAPAPAPGQDTNAGITPAPASAPAVNVPVIKIDNPSDSNAPAQATSQPAQPQP